MINKNLFILQSIDKHAAGGEDIFPAGAADGGSDAVGSEVIAQPDHLLFVRGG